MEPRTLLSTLWVVNNRDNGDDAAPLDGSLRWAIVEANQTASDAIDFAIGTGAQTIQPVAPLPMVTNPVFIDGTTQPGFAGTPLITLDGSLAGTAADGLVISAGNSTVRGLVIQQFGGSGIVLEGGGGNRIVNNEIGGTASVSDVPTSLTIAAQPNQDAVAYANFDFTPISSGVDLNQDFQGPYVRFALEGRDDAYRPAPGVIEEGRTVIELDLTPFQRLDPSLIESFVLNLNVGILENVGPGQLASSAGIRVWGFDGDGTITFDDFSPPTPADLGTIPGISSTGPIHRDITGFVRDLVSRNVQYAGINLQMDYASLPERSTLPDDTTFSISTTSADEGHAPSLQAFIDQGPSGVHNVIAGNGQDGIRIMSAANTVGGTTPDSRNVISANNGYGILITGTGASENQVQGNFIGTDATGTMTSDQDGNALGNRSGVVIIDAPANTVGGPSSLSGGRLSGAGNLISGNSKNVSEAKVQIYGAGATGNLVQGNFIGTDVTGTKALSHPDDVGGVSIAEGATNNTVGGLTPDLRNLISGNAGDGVLIKDHGTKLNLVEGNFIGTDVTGSIPLGNSGNGVDIVSTSGNTVGGVRPSDGPLSLAGNLISANGRAGVTCFGYQGDTEQNFIEGNFIGTDATGTMVTGPDPVTPGMTLPLGNAWGGVEVTTAGEIQIGGPGEIYDVLTENYNDTFGNVISGNLSSGVFIYTDEPGNFVAGNFIGTDVTGRVALGNQGNGVTVYGPDSFVGYPPFGGGELEHPYGNVISGNSGNGVAIYTNGNSVMSNQIGTDLSGTIPLGNRLDGVRVYSGSNNTIGGRTGESGNVIAYNGSTDVRPTAGVLVVQIGTVSATGNAILSNSIFSNVGLGIDLNQDGVTPNTPGGPHTGANNLQNYPVLTSVTGNSTQTTVQGTLNSTPNATFELQFYSNTVADPSGYGEGQSFLGSKSVTSNSNGDVSFSATFSTSDFVGQFISATSTDAAGNTSEFARDSQVALDSDGDGISDAVEMAAGGGSLAWQFPNVASLPNADNGSYVTLASPTGTTLADVQAISNPSPADAPAGVTFPIGFFSFTVQGVTPGGSTTVTLSLPAGVTATSYYKYGPTPDNPTNHWYNFAYDSTTGTGAEFGASQIVLHFMDGQRGDDDLTANGQIHEPGGPGEPPAPVQATPSFDSLVGPTIIYGTATRTLSGHIAAGSQIPTGNVSITLANMTQQAPIDTQGNFSAIFTTSSLVVSSSPYAISYSYAANASFTAANDTSQSLTVKPATLTVTADGKSRFYGDANPPFTGSITGIQNGDAITATYSTSAVASSDVGTYTIVPAAVDPSPSKLGNYSVTLVNGSLTVTQKPATATYTGPLFVATASRTTSTATVTLSATIKDTSGGAGDIRNATVTFVDRDTGVAIASNLPVTLVNSTDIKTGTASYNWSVDIRANYSQSFTIGIIVGKDYTRNDPSDNAVVTVSKPLAGSVTGGGYLVNLSTAGTVPGDHGAKTFFGFEAKSGSGSLTGGAMVLVSYKGHVYLYNSTSITSLTLPTGKTARFAGTGTIRDVTNPLRPITLLTNASLQVTMTDNGEPGTTDTIGITIRTSAGALWFSSDWNGTQTVEQSLSGGKGWGDLQVRPALEVAGGPATTTAIAAPLTLDELQPIAAEAAARWRAAGLSAQQLSVLDHVRFQVDDLGGSALGWAMPGVITLDRTADGYGWFLDPTPGDDSEFGPNESSAVRDHVDLLSTVIHEMGHELGFGDDDGNDVMNEYLAVGVRRVPASLDHAEEGHSSVVDSLLSPRPINARSSPSIGATTTPVPLFAAQSISSKRTIVPEGQPRWPIYQPSVRLGDTGGRPAPSEMPWETTPLDRFDLALADLQDRPLNESLLGELALDRLHLSHRRSAGPR